MRPGERVSRDEYEKEAVADFALWKARVAEDGEVFWPSPWGEGRPGWHIECSAMSMKILGTSFDLHLGGEDLVFPHHEDEIAQSEGALMPPEGKPFVKYWLHGAHLLVEGKKMSKSLGNYYTLRDLLGKGFAAREIRYLLLTAHYRESFNFTLSGLEGARESLRRLDECVRKLREAAAGASAAPDAALLAAFSERLNEDFNVAAVWGAIFDWVRDTNKLLTAAHVDRAQAAARLAAWEKIEAVLGVAPPKEAEAPAELLALLAERQAARKARGFQAQQRRHPRRAKARGMDDRGHARPGRASNGYERVVHFLRGGPKAAGNRRKSRCWRSGCARRVAWCARCASRAGRRSARKFATRSSTVMSIII